MGETAARGRNMRIRYWFNAMSIGARLRLGFALMLALMAAITVVAISCMSAN